MRGLKNEVGDIGVISAMRYNMQAGGEAILNRRHGTVVSMSFSTLYDSSVTDHSGLIPLETD